MHISASPAWDSWSELAARLPDDLDVDHLARETKAIQRHRGNGIEDGASLLRLSLAHGPGGKSLQETAAWARAAGVAELTAQSLNERLHRAVDFLAALAHRLLGGRDSSEASVWAGRSVCIVDSSSLSQPGSTGTDWRLHGVYDLGRGGFRHIEVTTRQGAESLLRCPPVAGEVVIADRGYAKAKELRACLDPTGPHGRDFIVRVGWKALALCDAAGDRFDLIEALGKIPAGTRLQEWRLQAMVGGDRRETRLPLRLIAVPLPADKAAINRKKLQRKASKHQDKIDPRSLLAAGFMVLATSLPAEIPAMDIYAAYRLRWQIELAFKRLKSLLGIDRLPTRTEAGSLSWLYAHLILLLLIEDLCQDFLDSPP